MLHMSLLVLLLLAILKFIHSSSPDICRILTLIKSHMVMKHLHYTYIECEAKCCKKRVKNTIYYTGAKYVSVLQVFVTLIRILTICFGNAIF